MKSKSIETSEKQTIMKPIQRETYLKSNLSNNTSNDEYIMKKLTEMSNQITNENRQHSKMKISDRKQSNKAEYDDEFPCKDLNKDEEVLKTELRTFLKAHNIRDGNLVETRRIDLRASQNITKPMSSISTEPSVGSLIARISTENGKEGLKYLNESEESSESSSDDEDSENGANNRELWIERYRKQKALNAQSEK